MSKEHLRVGLLSTPVLKAPTTAEGTPSGWSGAPNNVMRHIADGLKERGHEVTLFASGDTTTKANLEAVGPLSSFEDESIGFDNFELHELALVARCYRMVKQGQFDLVHSLFSVQSAAGAAASDTPTISTLHSPLDKIPRRISEEVANDQMYVSISDRQRAGYEFMNWVATIYNGIDTNRFAFHPRGSEKMLMVGRMDQEKGPHVAVQLAHRLQNELTLVGSHSKDPKDIYWRDIRKAMDSTLVRHVSFIDQDRLPPYYQNAKVLLNPIGWEEPFGLTTIESMASGTPLIAFARGSMPELIEDGITGFLVNPSDEDKRGDFIIQKTGIEGFEEATQRIYAMSARRYQEMRRNCRNAVESRFTIDHMVDRYERLFYHVLRQRSE